MLSGIFEVLQQIANFFTGLVDFVISLFKDLIWLITHLVEFVGMIPNFFAPLPVAISSCIAVCLSILVVLRVLGRDN